MSVHQELGIRRGKRRCAGRRYEWVARALPLRLTTAEWRRPSRWFALGQSCAVIAREAGLVRLLSRVVAEKEDAAEFVGFSKVGVLQGHAKDVDGRLRDVVIMEMPLGKWFEWWSY